MEVKYCTICNKIISEKEEVCLACKMEEVEYEKEQNKIQKIVKRRQKFND